MGVDISLHPQAPTSLHHLDEARSRFGGFADTYLAGMWQGDPLADAFVADFPTLGHGKAMRMLRAACRDGIDTVPDAPESLRRLFAELDATPAWVDLEAIERDSQFTDRHALASGIVLGAASLISGYANSAAARPLEMTGRYVENAGARTIEVGSWLRAINEPGGLDRYGDGFALTVRVRIIHALVRADLLRRPEWDSEAWGIPIPQSYLGFTLVEFTLIPLRAMGRIGAPFLPHEEAAGYARWRYLGHLLGIDPALLPRDEAEQARLEEIYLLTRPEVDDYCRDLVASINRDFLVPEVAGLLPRPFQRHAAAVVHGLERLFLGPTITDELGIPRTRLTRLIAVAGPGIGAINRLLDRIPATLPVRARRGRAYADHQDVRLRRDWGVGHDLVDDSPPGERSHPARGD